MSSSSPPTDDKLLVGVLLAGGFTKSEITTFREGKMISGTMESLSERELAGRLGCTIAAPAAELCHVFLNSQRKADASAFQVGDMHDLADLKLEPNRETVAKLYMKGASELNLSPEEEKVFKKCKSADNVEEALRTLLKARYEKYLELGLDGIDVYARGKKTYEPGAELKLKSSRSEILKKYAPVFYEYLNNYPHSKPDGIEEAFSWVNFTIDEKPTLCLVHKFGRMEGGLYAFCQRHFYVSRGHNSVQGVGGVFPLSETECAVVYGSRKYNKCHCG